MTQKQAYTLFGLLMSKPGMVLGDFEGETKSLDEIPPISWWRFIHYFRGLKIPFQIAYDVLDEFYNVFYHDDDPSPWNESEFDYIEFTDEGRIGIWCEVDGFIAWLDEYGKKWRVDDKKELIEKRKNWEKEWNEKYGKKLQEAFEVAWAKVEKENEIGAIEVATGEPKMVKIQPFEMRGISMYDANHKKLKTMKDIEEWKKSPCKGANFASYYDYVLESLYDWYVAKLDGVERILLFLADWDFEAQEYWYKALKERAGDLWTGMNTNG